MAETQIDLVVSIQRVLVKPGVIILPDPSEPDWTRLGPVTREEAANRLREIADEIDHWQFPYEDLA